MENLYSSSYIFSIAAIDFLAGVFGIFAGSLQLTRVKQLKNVSDCQRAIGNAVVTLSAAAAAFLLVSGFLVPLLSYAISKKWSKKTTGFVVARIFIFFAAMFLCGYGQALKSRVDKRCKIVRPGVLICEGLLCFLVLILSLFLLLRFSKEKKTSEGA